jgi:ATP-dependent exoDNAse (exonuclease V) beta subunit
MSTGTADDIEEERRLLYVAMTRAKDQQALIVPHRFFVRGQARSGDRHLERVRPRRLATGRARRFVVTADKSASNGRSWRSHARHVAHHRYLGSAQWSSHLNVGGQSSLAGPR